MLVKAFLSNVLIDIPYNTNKSVRYKHVWYLFNAICLYLHTVIAMHCSNENEKLLNIFAYSSNNRALSVPELNL